MLRIQREESLKEEQKGKRSLLTKESLGRLREAKQGVALLKERKRRERNKRERKRAPNSLACPVRLSRALLTLSTIQVSLLSPAEAG